MNPATSSATWRAVNAAEVASVVLSILLVEWAFTPFLISPWPLAIPPLLALALMLYSHHCRGETARDLGFGGRHFGRAIRLLATPTALAIVGLIVVSYFARSLHLPERFWARITLLPLWALLQQYFLLGFVYRRLRKVAHANQIMVIGAALFALVHAPNYSLMILTFIGGLIWSYVYERAPNLFAPAISHLLLSATVLLTIPESILPAMTVGYRYLLHHNF